MTAPFAYTHPRNISSGYRTTSRTHEDDYSSKPYPADEDEYYRHPPHPAREAEEYSCSRYNASGSDYSHKPAGYSTTYDDYSKHSTYSREDDVYHKSHGKSEDSYYHAKMEDEYPMYHRDHCKMTRGANCCTCVDDLQEVKVQSRRPQEGYTRISSDTHSTAKDYHEAVEETDASGQFYPQQVVVVTSQRGGTTAKTLSREPPPPPRHLATSGGCCQSAVALVLITLLVVAFLLISGFLFYFNIVTYAPESSSEDLCEDVHCAHGGICMVDSEGQPVCRCPVDCPEVLVPVCGTDGQTYDNMCALRLHSCTNKRTILVQHTGPCDTGDPCQEKQCTAGATCEVSEDGLTASCVCPQHCPVYSNHLAMSPLCGTDNRDYTDQCQMFRQACEHGVSVSVKYEGPCDPCASKECPVPEVCQLDEDRQPECRCAEVCAEDMNPVCGSDGYTYINECFMRLQACWTKTSLRVIFRGPCSSGINPCKGVVCSDGEECTVSKFGISQCECVSQCEPVVRQVCGSDAKTYDSECHLRKSSCLERSGVTFLYNGACDELSCKDMVCENEAQCVMRDREPLCQCPRCAPHYEPLCGSDGRNYNSPCELRASNCHHKRNVESVHQGVCNGCETKTCSYFASCETDKEGIAKCVCIDKCPEEEKSASVCGSNGVTYKSECELRKFVCEKKELVEVDYEGDCESCLEVVCKYGARCRAGVCVCPTDCPQHLDEPVCASNLETYDNECDMQKQACAFNPPALLTVIFFGACSIKFKINRSNHTTTPTTVTTAMTPRNPCLDIQCDYGASCELGEDGFPRCSCLFDCSQEDLTLICGSDFHIYNSSCAMKMEACQRQKEIRLRPLDLCKGMEVKPCNGEGAVVDQETGEELDCGSGPKRKDCPLDSYCHQTPHFARCCPKESGVYLKSCQDSWYGCCPDKKTPAQGPEHLGCPSLCGCNKIGSYSEACVGDSDQCQCKPGVGGLKCDRCEPGYWGLPKITSGYQGCLACECSALGSVREDCEQMTGRCVCKPGVQGHKCDSCVDPQHSLSTRGCTSEVESTPSSLCEDIACGFGADCVETPDGPQCVCSLSCPESELEEMTCGDDGKLYASKCQLELFVCQVQKQIGFQDMSYCSGIEDKSV